MPYNSRQITEALVVEEKKVYKFVCTVCGHVVESDTPELPDDFVCPLCGVGKDCFVPQND